MPEITQGDYLGIFTDKKNLSPAFEIKDGVNQNIEIPFTRKVFSFDAHITGTVNGPDTGDLTLIAYAGEIISSDVNDLAFDSIIGVKTITFFIYTTTLLLEFQL